MERGRELINSILSFGLADYLTFIVTLIGIGILAGGLVEMLVYLVKMVN